MRACGDNALVLHEELVMTVMVMQVVFLSSAA